MGDKPNRPNKKDRSDKQNSSGRQPSWAVNTELFLTVVLVSETGHVLHQLLAS
jgi:hypothetical protein